MALVLLALPLWAQTPLDGATFDRLTQGKTFYYAVDGLPYGGETYLKGQRVRWSFLDGKCKQGRWYTQGEMICFIYEDTPNPQCWRFYQQNGQLKAQFDKSPPEQALFGVEQSDEPLLCLGPEIGV